jgi:hypothetical protein
VCCKERDHGLICLALFLTEVGELCGNRGMGIEQVPTPLPIENGEAGDAEKNENVDPSSIEIGDRLYSHSGTYREVRRILKDDNFPGGGEFEIERVGTDGERKPQLLSFDDFVAAQEALKQIEKPALPSGIDHNSDKLTSREKAALTQIESQLKQRDLPQPEQEETMRARADILWNIKDRIEREGDAGT